MDDENNYRSRLLREQGFPEKEIKEKIINDIKVEILVKLKMFKTSMDGIDKLEDPVMHYIFKG